jgi:hypothetical protein
VESAEALFDGFVDLTVVGNRGLPAHAANETDDLQEESCLVEGDAARVVKRAIAAERVTAD